MRNLAIWLLTDYGWS